MPQTERRPFDPKYISYSEASYFAQCEEKWRYAYPLKKQGKPSQAMLKGTAVHNFAEAFWNGDETFEWPEDINPDTAGDAQWLMGRYKAMYTEMRDSETLKMVEHEAELSAMIPGTRVTLTSHIDALATDKTGAFWVVERKTMKDWRRIEFLRTDWQITLYYWLMQANGYPVEGVAYDAIRTYRWTRDEHKHPPSDSFQWLWLMRNEGQVESALENLRQVISRRADILRSMKAGNRSTIKNISYMNCGNCPYKEPCFEDEMFPAFSIEVLDELD